MSIVLLAISLVIFSAVAIKLSKQLKLWKTVRNLSGPMALPLLGNSLQIGYNPRDYLKNLFKWWEKYGPNPFRVWIFNQLYIIISDPKDVEAVLLSSPQLKKAHIYDLLYPWLGEGLLTSYGTKWYKHRKVITPSFHFTILVDFFDVMNKVSSNFMKKLSPKAKTGEIFDMQAMVHYCTLDVICETAMGYNLDSMNNPNSDVVTAFQDLCYFMQQRMFRPPLHNDFLYMLTSNYRKQRKALNILKDFTSGVIQKRHEFLKEVEKNGSVADQLNDKDEDDGGIVKSKKKVFLDTLLTSMIDGEPLSFAEIFEEVSTFMFEGHDTTTSGITFAIYLLSRHPEVQDKVFEEQKLIFGSNLQRDATYQEILDMKYLELVIKESQRLFPSVPMIAREVTEKFNLNGQELLPGTTVTLFLIAMGYNKKNFTDPSRFDPDRFDCTKRDLSNPFEYVPFSAGPRNCIGQKFAILEMKSVLSKLVRNFKILPPVDGLSKDYNPGHEPKNEYDPIISAVLTSKADTGVKVRLRPRNV